MEYTYTAATTIEAPPTRVFERLTDLERLPDWNLEIPKVHTVPEVLAPGAQWTVEIHAMGTHWVSRSTAHEVDPAAGRFAYRSQSDDGNPSHADWVWEVTAHGTGTRVVVTVGVHPRTFLRKWFLARLRRRGLQKAVHQSLASLREIVPTTSDMEETA